MFWAPSVMKSYATPSLVTKFIKVWSDGRENTPKEPIYLGNTLRFPCIRRHHKNIRSKNYKTTVAAYLPTYGINPWHLRFIFCRALVYCSGWQGRAGKIEIQNVSDNFLSILFEIWKSLDDTKSYGANKKLFDKINVLPKKLWCQKNIMLNKIWC